MRDSTSRQIIPYALVVFLGYMGFAFPLPLLPVMFLDPESSFLPISYSLKVRGFLLGVLMTSYPLGQLIGSPFLGKLSDAHGRKRIILYSLIGTACGYLIAAKGVSLANIFLMFIGLFISGLCEGNIAIAQSVVADLSEHEIREKKLQYFGWINIFSSCGFIVGPIIGGQLSDSSFVPWFTFATPFWMAAIMTVVSLVVICTLSKETIKEKAKASFSYFASIKEGFYHSELRLCYLGNFFLGLAYFSYWRFFPVYLEKTFNFSATYLGYAMAYGAIIFAVFTLLFLKRVTKWLSPLLCISIFAFFLGISYFVTMLPKTPMTFLWTIPFMDICLGVLLANGSLIISDLAGKRSQGKALGILTSVHVLAEISTGIGGGIVTGYSSYLPMAIGAIMAWIAAAIFLTNRSKLKIDKRFNEVNL